VATYEEAHALITRHEVEATVKYVQLRKNKDFGTTGKFYLNFFLNRLKKNPKFTYWWWLDEYMDG